MSDVRRVPLPRSGSGTVTWESLVPYLETITRDIYAKFDPRNPQSSFAGSFLANPDGSATIGDTARVTSQRTLPTVNTGSRLSAQNIAPLSSVFDNPTSTITIAAHTVQYGFGVVAYGGGSISGLDAGAFYYVYANDPDYSGGAVSYAATQTAPEVVASNQRYYVGAITTANSGTPTSGTGGGAWGWQELEP